MTLNYAIDSVCLWRPRSSKDEKIGNNTCHYLEVIQKGRPDHGEKKSLEYKFGVLSSGGEKSHIQEATQVWSLIVIDFFHGEESLAITCILAVANEYYMQLKLEICKQCFTGYFGMNYKIQSMVQQAGYRVFSSSTNGITVRQLMGSNSCFNIFIASTASQIELAGKKEREKKKGRSIHSARVTFCLSLRTRNFFKRVDLIHRWACTSVIGL